MTATSDGPLRDGIVATADGWSVRYDTFLVSAGHASVEGDSCKGYSDPAYNRVLNMLIAGPQMLGIVYALGHCDFDFELSSPYEDSLLGEGVSEQDKTFMRTPATDPYASGAGVSIHVVGKATKGGAEKRFDWSYRFRINFASCEYPTEGGVMKGFDLAQGGSARADVQVRGGTLWQDHLDEAKAALRFQAYADADAIHGNNDGEVSLAEIEGVPLSDVATSDRYADGLEAGFHTLGQYLYNGLFPQVLRYHGDGSCEMDLMPNDRATK
ncbi:MAG: hypothetical protein HY898_05445 [Deltaproteobacteria bacterium]|nr:hypothetical protein [Deltaproteobacteria bacterium]